MKRILLLGLANGWNKGTMALFECICENIRDYNEDIQFILSKPKSRNLGNYFKDMQFDNRLFSPNFREPLSIIIPLITLIECINMRLFSRSGKKLMKQNSKLFNYYTSDLIIVAGGDNLSGEYGHIIIIGFINILYAILMDKPVVLLGMDVGPYENRMVRKIANFVLNRAKIIILREELSLKYLKDNDISSPKIFLSADPVFLLKSSPPSRVLEILRNENLSGIKKPLIGITPSPLIANFMGKDYSESKEMIISIFSKVIDDLIESIGATIIMVPHVYGPMSEDDDRQIINSIWQISKNKDQIKSIKGEYSPQDLKGIIGLCDLYIGARMHSTIASTSMLVPTIGIAYSHKMHGIVGEALNQKKYIIDIKELTYDRLISTINDAWKNRDNIREELITKIPLIQEKARGNGEIIRDIITK